MDVNATKKKTRYWPGLLVVGLLLAAEAVLFATLVRSGLLPAVYLLVGGGVLVLLAALVYLLVRRFDRRVRFVVGSVLAALLIALLLVVLHFVQHGFGALSLITKPQVETVGIGVYVEKDDPAQSIQDTKGYTFGVLETLDWDNTTKAADQLTDILGEEVKLKLYPDLGSLVDAVRSGEEVQAALLNVAFMELLGDIEGREDDPEQLRQVYVLEVEVPADPEPDTPDQPSTPGQNGNGGREENPEGVFTMFISGIDAEGRIGVRSRSDVNILATVNTNTRQILLVSTPRDYFVPLSISGGIPDKLTHAGIYGVDVSMDTLGMLYDEDINYYFRVNFTGFRKIIDALGGITVQSDYTFSAGKTHFVKGANQVDGKTALAFARCRYTVPGGDRQRGRHQMAVVKGVIEKACSPALLTNFAQVMEGVADSFQTSMPYDEISALVRRQLSDGTPWNVVSYSVNGTGASRQPYSLSSRAYVMLPDYATVEHAKELIEQVKKGEVPTP